MFTSPNVDVQVDWFPKSPNRQMPAVKKSLWLQINGSSEQKLRFEPSIFVDISWVYKQRGTEAIYQNFAYAERQNGWWFFFQHLEVCVFLSKFVFFSLL